MTDQADASLLGLFLRHREVFERHERLIPEHLLEQGTKTVLADIQAWYKTHKRGNVTDQIDAFWEWVKLQRHPTFSDKKIAGIKVILQRALKASSSATAGKLLQTLVLRDYAGGIADKADRFSAGETDFDLFSELLDDIEAAKRAAGLHQDHSHEVRTPLAELLERIRNPKDGLTWRLNELRDAIGPLRHGDLAVVVAYVDSGKSTMVASEATHMATQLKPGEHVLFFNNEEAGDKVRLRLMRSLLGWTNEQLLQFESVAMTKMQEMLGGTSFDERIVLVDNATISTGLVRSKIREYNPKLLVFDQLYKIVGVRSPNKENEVEGLRRKFEYARGLAKEVAPVLAVHQANSQTNGELFIEMHQLAGSGQAIQGEVDFLITLGKDLTDPSKRGLYVPKNKSDTPGDNALRSAKFPIYPDFSRARFE